jgi:MFS family permease
MPDYWKFFQDEFPLLGYGLSLTFFSSFGQTFFISLSVPFLLASHSLSNGEFGTLYSAATLGSAALLPWTGKWLDRTSLLRFTLAIVLLLATSALLVAASWNLLVLFLGLLGLRLAGPGLAGYTAFTAMARSYAARRGKALGICSLGFPMGEAVLPLLGTVAIAWVGWRGSWALITALSLVFFAPLFRTLLLRSSGSPGSSRLPEARTGSDGPEAARPRDTRTSPVDAWDPAADPTPRGEAAEVGDASWSRRRAVRDSLFWFALPASLLPAFWATGIFLYQSGIGELKGWSIPVMASAFTAFAVTRIGVSLAAAGSLWTAFRPGTSSPSPCFPWGWDWFSSSTSGTSGYLSPAWRVWE